MITETRTLQKKTVRVDKPLEGLWSSCINTADRSPRVLANLCIPHCQFHSHDCSLASCDNRNKACSKCHHEVVTDCLLLESLMSCLSSDFNSLCFDCDRKCQDPLHVTGTRQFPVLCHFRFWLQVVAARPPRWPRPSSVVTFLTCCRENCFKSAHLDLNGSVEAKSTRPWLDVPLWRRRSLPMNEGGHLICVIASKSTLDSSLDGWDYNADAEFFLATSSNKMRELLAQNQKRNLLMGDCLLGA